MKAYPEIIHRIYDLYGSLRCVIPVYRHPLRGGEQCKPLFIIGSGRSGNTLLRKLLNRHSLINIPPETYVLGAVISRYRQHRSMKWCDLVDYTLSTFEFYPEFETFNISLRPLAQELKSIPVGNRNLAFILNRFYQYCSQPMGGGCERWGDKTPLNTFYLDRIISVFPDAQFIHLLRDGCDVVSSYVEAGIYSSYEDAAERWDKSVRLAERFLMRHPGTGVTIRYESLVSDPDEVLKKLCLFLGVDLEPEMLEDTAGSHKMGDVEMRSHHANVLNPISTKSIGRGRALLSGKEKAAIQGIIGDQLESLGYKNCMS